MNNFIIYSAEIAISFALFYSAYWIFLKKETFFKLNRFYLVSSLAISLLMPLLNITLVTYAGQNAFITKYLVLPIERYEQRITGTGNGNNALPEDKRSFPVNIRNGENGNALREEEAGSAATKPILPTALNSPGENDPDKTINWLMLLPVIYFIGFALLLIRFIANLGRIFTYASKNETEQMYGAKVIRLKMNSSPFSFLNTVFISNKYYPEPELIKIIAHEKVHIRQKHSLDLIALELLLVFQWFNPFVWLYKRSIKITHEYLADQGVLHSGIDLPGYQYSLLSQALSKNNIDLASTYNLSVKKRIIMMMKERSSKLSALKLGVAIPILMLIFSAFAFSTGVSKSEMSHSNTNKLPAFADSTIKKVSVPVAYLKLLEGEYVSTNDPGHVRKIRFTEVMGELLGNDNGYIYKIIPVGGEKFTNPDDGAAFVFNTRDKDAITLLFFGKINLKKVKSTRKSIAYSLVEVMLKDGITPANARYNAIRDSGSYYLQEGEMNFAGYMLLQAGKAKEAAAIFKLNAEAYPNSFNVYDSYGEALMAIGERTLALENYKRSVQLNPGSASGIKALKDAGINTDALIKKVPLAYLKSLEGKYISTNDPYVIRKIVFKEEGGILTGNDNGYKYKLIPVADGKFINPDDGVSFVFDTKNKNEITLLFSGRTLLKKVTTQEESTAITTAQDKSASLKEVSVSTEYLRLLAGQYMSTNQPKGVRRIAFEEINGELVGDDNGYVYKLIPTGEGKFTNPDDGASFVFDTKNKNEITLLLFGKINLKKIN